MTCILYHTQAHCYSLSLFALLCLYKLCDEADLAEWDVCVVKLLYTSVTICLLHLPLFWVEISQFAEEL